MPDEKHNDHVGFRTENPLHLFLWGGLSTCAGEFTTLPIDVLKVRLQIDAMSNKSGVVRSSGSFHLGSMSRILVRLVKEEGVFALWSGVTPALLRQLMYGGLRLGLYEPVKQMLNGGQFETKENKVPYWKKVLAGVICGSTAAAMVTPTDVLKIRFQAGKNFQQQRYKSTFHAVKEIIKVEGVRGLYKGVAATSLRASIITAIELSVYDDCKYLISQYEILQPGFPTHLAASLASGLIASIFANPIDFIKTRIQGQPVDASGKGIHYKNAVDCLVKTIRSEGILALTTGFFPHYLRRGPHLVVSFLTLEYLRDFGHKYLD
eukprot:TRINITY_DN2461_c0_g1_i1.p1 TRINITY_DN2461_c0_g1~~TRINITY_DN2461_c0_g1_i1.p1  ORF type:complete len:331 (+),score=56.08 TRINITY_DN2461_c0_g1_i1:35-994(+)